MSIQLAECKLLTIICELSLEPVLVADLKALGARGHTVIDARGDGAHGVRDASWSSSGNIRVEVLCSEPVALTILEHLEKRYYANYGMVAFLVDAKVVRPEKF